MGKGNLGEAVDAGAIADHGRGARTDEYKRTRADEFCKEPGCNPVGHRCLQR
jgi:hypothetical protein